MVVVVTRVRHPLQGQALAVLGRMRRHGRLELLVVLPDGSKTLVPAIWTDLDAVTDGGPAAATLGSLEDLLHTSAAVSALSAHAKEQAARQSPSKEDNRAAYPAQSAGRPGASATPDAAGPASPAAGGGGDRAAGPPDRQDGRGGDGDRR
jgi:Family of unknown function (DUF5372)